MRAMPKEIEKTLYLDGCSRCLGVFWITKLDGIEIIRAIMFESYRLQKFQFRSVTEENLKW